MGMVHGPLGRPLTQLLTARHDDSKGSIGDDDSSIEEAALVAVLATLRYASKSVFSLCLVGEI